MAAFIAQSPELGDLLEIWGPAAVQNYVNNVAAGFHALSADFKLQPMVLSDVEKAAWETLLRNFLGFYKGVGFFSRLYMGTVRTAEGFSAQLRFWRDIYAKKTGKIPTGAVVDIPAESNQATLKTVAIVAGVVAVSWLGIEALKTVRVFKAA